MDNWILDAARDVGAKVFENVLVTGFTVESEGVKVTAKDAEGNRVFHASLLIGADGTNSLIGSILRGYLPPKQNRIVGVRGYFEGVEGSPNQVDLHFGTEGFSWYCWLFPTGETQANVGVGLFLEAMSRGNEPKETIYRLINEDEGLKNRLKNATLKGDFESSPLYTYDPHLPIVGDRVMLVGEAAGLVNPINGEGIQYALLSGRWASETALSAMDKGDFSRGTLSAYSKQVDDQIGYGFKISALIIQLMRNRNLNPLWLKTFETIISRSKTDPQYANIAGGMLAGLVTPSQGLDPKFLISTLGRSNRSRGTANSR